MASSSGSVALRAPQTNPAGILRHDGSWLSALGRRLDLRDGSGHLLQRAYGTDGKVEMDVAGLPCGTFIASSFHPNARSVSSAQNLWDRCTAYTANRSFGPGIQIRGEIQSSTYREDRGMQLLIAKDAQFILC